MRKRTFIGTGSRTTPSNIVNLMRRTGAAAFNQGFSLRTGGDQGADLAFESGARDALGLSRPTTNECHPRLEIYLPWPGFNGHADNPFGSVPTHLGTSVVVNALHPCASYLSRKDFALMRRNCHLVLGDTLRDPANFVVCWTENGASTLQDLTSSDDSVEFVIRLACIKKIPVFNLQRADHRERITRWVSGIEKDSAIHYCDGQGRSAVAAG